MPDLERIIELMPAVSREMRRAPNILHTFDAVEGNSIDFQTIHAHSLRRKELRIPNRVRAATVVTLPVMVGISRMFESMNNNPELEMRSFENRAEAEAWVAVPEPD